MTITIADHYDAELRRHNERFRPATGIASGDCVLDVGCGRGQSTRDAARAAPAGHVVGIDISAPMLERARQLTLEEGLSNVTYELGDAEVHSFPSEHFDVVISRFGMMFFTNAVAAFTNLAHAMRRGARLVMMVWQRPERNEWATAIHRALSIGSAAPRFAVTQNPFSLGDRPVVDALLHRAGFLAAGFAEVHEPVYYGPDVDTAYGIVRSMKCTSDMIASLDAAAAERASDRLRAVLAAHTTKEGVLFESRAWIVTARRGQ
jgi:SAM-dependent methyltransferase